MNFSKAWESYQLYRKYRGALATGFSPQHALSKAGKKVGMAMALAAVGAAVGVLNDSTSVKLLLDSAGLNEAWVLLLTGAIGIIGSYAANMLSEQTKYVASPVDGKPIDAKTAESTAPVTQTEEQWDALTAEIKRLMRDNNWSGPDGFSKARALAINVVVGETVATQPQPAKVVGP